MIETSHSVTMVDSNTITKTPSIRVNDAVGSKTKNSAASTTTTTTSKTSEKLIKQIPMNGNHTRSSSSVFVITLTRRSIATIFITALVLAFTAGRFAHNIESFRATMRPKPVQQWWMESSPTTVSSSGSLENGQHPTRSSHATFNPIGDSQSCVAEGRRSASGQHLLVDIAGVDGLLLESEDRLQHVMLKILNESDTTALSAECLLLSPKGSSCFGLSQRTHVLLQAWPSKGVIMLNFYTSSTQSVLNLIPQLEHLFAPAIPGDSEDGDRLVPRIKWSYKKRGFDRTDDLAMSAKDTIELTIGSMEREKGAVASLETDLRRIDVFDVLGNEQRDRAVFVNDVIRSRKFGEAAFHEALVHPVMFLHEEPAHVAIVGGVLGGSLREVLKHNTVEEVVLVGVDEKFVEMAREHLPEWSDCSNLMGSTPSCFDDPRVEFVFEDAASWFTSNFLDESDDSDDEDLFNVIIVDILYPTSTLDYLLDDEDLLTSLYNSLEDSGVISVPTGRVEKLTDRSSSPKQSLYQLFLDEVEDVGFENAVSFSKAHSHSHSPWSFLAIMKDREFRANWFSNEAGMNLDLLLRVAPTKNSTPFRYFDGATMMSYKYPSRIEEDIYCGHNPPPKECNDRGFDPERQHFPASRFEVKHSGAGVKSGRGVYAKENVPAGSYIALDECVNGMYVSPWTVEILDDLQAEKGLPYWNTFRKGYIDGYGWSDYVYGIESAGVDQGITSFMNHGCNGTYNYGIELPVNEQTAVLGAGPVGNGYDDEVGVYDALSDRMFPMWDCGSSSIALSDIKVGGEVLDNYLVHSGEMATVGEDGWEEEVMGLRSMCAGESIGLITAYEGEAYEQEVPSSQ